MTSTNPSRGRRTQARAAARGATRGRALTVPAEVAQLGRARRRPPCPIDPACPVDHLKRKEMSRRA